MEHPIAKKRVSTLVETTIDPAEEKVIDSIVFSSFYAAKYLIAVSSLDGARVLALEALAVKKNGGVNDSIYSKLGEPFSLTTEFLKSNDDMTLRLTNGEAETLRVSFLRFQI